ncbi:MAG: N-acetylmuramoyl-L-alanine amidase [Cytophagaceae bacterium]
MHFKRGLSVFLLSIIVLCSAFTTLEQHTGGVKIIVIDAGHGGKDPGCLGSSAKEKAINLDISLKVGKMIKDSMPSVKVIYTRPDDRFVELHDRAGIANKYNADLFISIHSNSGPKGMHGTETYCMGLHKTEQNLEVAKRENSSILMEKDHTKNYDGFDPNSPQSYILFSLYQNGFLTSSLSLASKIEKEFKVTNKRHSRGVKQAGFLVLWKTSMPSVLVETGFLTDSTEEHYLSSEQGKIKTARGIFKAVKEYKEEMED